MMRWLVRATLMLACLAAGAPSRADTVTLPSDRDNTLYESATGALSNGAGPTLFSGRTNQATNSRRRGLLHFDVASAVPAGSSVTGVTLRLRMSLASTPDPRATALHPVIAGWGEGTSNAGPSGGSGAAATTGDATWLHRFFAATPWTTAGGDFAATASATQSVGAEGTYVWGSSASMVADAQGWLDTPGSNFGWLVLGVETSAGTSKRFDTREAIDPEARPLLTITYVPGGTPARGTTWGRIRAAWR